MTVTSGELGVSVDMGVSLMTRVRTGRETTCVGSIIWRSPQPEIIEHKTTRQIVEDRFFMFICFSGNVE